MRAECVEKNYKSCEVCPEYKKCPDADPLYKKKRKKVMKGLTAEQKFKKFTSENGIEIQRGLPDYMIIKNGEVMGFVEVKRDDLNDLPRENQLLFMRFCRKHKIPYQVWSPIMAGKKWETANKRFKDHMRYAKEDIWDKI